MVRNRRTRRPADVNLTPLIDTMFVLLIVVLIAAPIAHHALTVSLPYGALREHTNVPREAYVIIYADGRMEAVGQKKPGTVDEALTALMRYRDEHPYDYLVVYADEQASFGTALTLIDQLKRQTGVHRVVCKTQRPRT